jgi:purine-binding chemotaxis protein CheW
MQDDANLSEKDGQYDADKKEYLTCILADQSFGIPVLQIQDVLSQQPVTKIPLCPTEIEGSLNLRGRIVTAVNLRRKLGLPPRQKGKKNMSIVVEHQDELYSLTVDAVGDVVSLPKGELEKNPANLEENIKSVSSGIYRMEKDLLVILDVSALIGTMLSASVQVA